MIQWGLFFTDPILRGPTLGCMLMGFICGLIGVLAYVRRRSLLGEALSHATYPGVIAGLFLSVFFQKEEHLASWVLIGAGVTAFLGFWSLDLLERKRGISEDVSLCFVLVVFFGVGTLLASIVQFSHPHLYQEIQSYLYGQAATLGNTHVLYYSLFGLIACTLLFLFYKEILILSFDRGYAKAAGIARPWLDFLLFLLIVLAVVMGVRTVGVVLMSALLIAPPLAARQFTDRLSSLFVLSALFGMGSGFFGNYLSLVCGQFFSKPGAPLSFPTGPMIVVTAAFFTLISLLFAPKKGVVMRHVRKIRFQYVIIQENILKTLWHLSLQGQRAVEIKKVGTLSSVSTITLKVFLYFFQKKGWIARVDSSCMLLPNGVKKGGKIVRFHRLWELYLVNSLGVRVDHVHRSAEEMEHVMTPALEKELTRLLEDPKEDPHSQPIPPLEEL